MAYENALGVEGAVVEWKLLFDESDWNASDVALPAGYGMLFVGSASVRLVNGDTPTTGYIGVRVRIPALLSASGARVTVDSAAMSAGGGGQCRIDGYLSPDGSNPGDEPAGELETVAMVDADPVTTVDVSPNPAEFAAFETTGVEPWVGGSVNTTNS